MIFIKLISTRSKDIPFHYKCHYVCFQDQNHVMMTFLIRVDNNGVQKNPEKIQDFYANQKYVRFLYAAILTGTV